MKRILLALSILLMSKFVYPIDLYWNVNYTAYEHNMSVTATVYVENVEQQNEMLELAAFCGDELRASALPMVSKVTGKLIYSITIYGHEDNEDLTFKLYDHASNEVSELVSEQILKFSINGIIGDANAPYIVYFNEPNPCFTGNGSWYNSSNWKNSMMPTLLNSDVIVDGDAVISNDVEINSLVINEGKSLTIENGGSLTVNGTLTNSDVNALIIEEGGQIRQNNDDVAATFKNNIESPNGSWGEEDKTGWQFVASPVANVSVNDFVPINGDYDLYMYDGTKELQWVNFKNMGSQSYDFSTNPLNDGWTSIEANGDELNWTYQPRGRYMYSVTYDNVLWDIFAKNYFVSPKITINEGTKLKFNARCTDNEYYPETFKLLLSEGSNSNPNDFNIEVDNCVIENTSFQTYTYDLSEFAGKSVYVAFYHYVAPENLGSGQLILDDIEFVNDNNFENCKGYLVSYQSEAVSEFKGILNNEPSYTIKTNAFSSDNNLANFSLLGNPYPFDIDWENNVTVEGVYDGYAMVDSKDGSYKYYTNGHIKTGEGFMVKSIDGISNQVVVSKSLNRTANEDSYVNIVSSGKNGSDNLIIRFGENENTGFPKMENFNKDVALVYVNDDECSYGIYNYSNDITEIPVYFDAKEMGSFTMSFDVKGEFENLYLIDSKTGEKINLLLENEYTFMATGDDNTERFLLMKKGNSQQTSDNTYFAYINNGDIVIYNAEGNADVRIFDALGRCVYNTSCSDVINRISTDGFTSGVYMIQKVDKSGTKVEKVVL